MKRGLVALLAVLAFAACNEAKPVVHADQPVQPVKAGVHFTKAHWVEPYGGCDEAYRYPGTPGYRQCVRHGEVLPQNFTLHTVTNHLLPSGGGSSW